MNFQAIEKNVCINFSSLPLAQFPFYINIFASIFFPLFHFFLLLLLLIVLPLLFDPRWKESREREREGEGGSVKLVKLSTARCIIG